MINLRTVPGRKVARQHLMDAIRGIRDAKSHLTTATSALAFVNGAVANLEQVREALLREVGIIPCQVCGDDIPLGGDSTLCEDCQAQEAAWQQ